MSRIVGPGLEPGNHHERDSVLVDTRGAVLLDNINTCVVEHSGSDTGQAVALEMAGRVNHSSARSTVLYLMDEAGAAKLVGDLISLAARNGTADRFMAAVAVQLEAGR